MPQVQQPEALIFANDRPTSLDDDLYQWSIDAEDLIRRQHASIAELVAAQAGCSDLDGNDVIRIAGTVGISVHHDDGYPRSRSTTAVD